MKDIFETLNLLDETIKPLNQTELTSLDDALDAVLAEDIYAKKNVPSFDNSALDGYAFNYNDKDLELEIKGCILAGDKNNYEISKAQCYKIMTGAKMPKNSDTVLMIEDEVIENNKLLIKTKVEKFNACRFKAEEIKQNDLLLSKNTKLDASSIALLASQGIYKVKTYRKLKIAIFSSGDELVEPWNSADENSIYNSNALIIQALCKRFARCELCYLGICKDNLNDTKELFSNTKFDLIICSGGTSKGQADFVHLALEELNYEAIFKNVKAKPAKVTKLYKKNDTFALILPGNPMASYLSCFIFARKIIDLLYARKESFNYVRAYMKNDLKIAKNRNNFILGKLEANYFAPEENFSSYMISPLVRNDYVLISKQDQELIKANEEILLLKLV